MTSQGSDQGLSLYNAARAVGVTFAREIEPMERFVVANGLRFHYLEWGDRAKPTILLLHGFAQTCHSWDFVSLSLADRFHVIALDQRGHGDSEWAPDGDYSPESQQRDINAIVEALGLNDLILMGLSMGGRNAFTYAANHPETVKALVVVDASPENLRAGSQNIKRFVQQEDELDSLDDFVERVRVYNPRRPISQIRGSIAHNLKQLPNGKWTWKYDRVLRTPGGRPSPDHKTAERLWGYVDSLKCPTLIVRGAASDVVALETAEQMRLRIPNGQLATVEGAGHLVMGDNPSGFERMVSAFLQGLE